MKYIHVKAHICIYIQTLGQACNIYSVGKRKGQVAQAKRDSSRGQKKKYPQIQVQLEHKTGRKYLGQEWKQGEMLELEWRLGVNAHVHSSCDVHVTFVLLLFCFTCTYFYYFCLVLYFIQSLLFRKFETLGASKNNHSDDALETVHETLGPLSNLNFSYSKSYHFLHSIDSSVLCLVAFRPFTRGCLIQYITHSTRQG